MFFFHPTEISPNHPTIQQLFIPSIISSSSYPATFHPIYYFFIQLSNNFSSHLVFFIQLSNNFSSHLLFLHPTTQQTFIPSNISSSNYPTAFHPIYIFHPAIQQLFIPLHVSIQLSNFLIQLSNYFSSNYVSHPTIQRYFFPLI
jgi:hypothetical protein